MKLRILSLAAISTALMFAACSDDSTPSASTSTAVIDNPSGVDNGIGGQGGVIPGVDNSANGGVNAGGNTGTTTVPVDNTPVTEIPSAADVAGNNVSAADKVSDGTESVTSQNVSVKGYAEGPFLSGAKVSVASVDAKTMAATPSSVSATVGSSKGQFSLSGSINSAVALVTVEGKYLNATDGNTASSATFTAYTDMRTRSSVNVNMLTRLETNRVNYLVGTLGMSFTAAKQKAEKEVLAAFYLPLDTTEFFEDISIFDRSQGAVNLMAVTSIITNERSESDINTIIETIAADIADNGVWDNEELKTKLADEVYFFDNSFAAYQYAVAGNVDNVENFGYWVKHFWAYQYGLGICSHAMENTEAALKYNSNEASVRVGMLFECADTTWTEASDAAVENLAAVAELGTCTTEMIGTSKVATSGKTYVCKSTGWREAGDAEVVSIAISQTASGSCTSASQGKVAQYQSAYYLCNDGLWTKLDKTPVDYTKGRAMNKKLGRGINFGNSWDNPSDSDKGWNEGINDGDFTTVKNAGFNSVRIPVRWYTGMNNKISGVKADVQLAINAGLTVIINSHHNEPIYQAAKNNSLNSKLNDFKSEWKQIAQAFDSFPDDALVFEIFNEPHDMTQDQVNQIMSAGYEAIRSVSKGKTIMFESNGYSKFAQIPKLNLPNDGNIIVSGHYYEPYTFTHQGHGDAYPCNGSANDGIASMAGQFANYNESISLAYPDLNGGSVPVNLGEFGVANKGSCTSISDSKRDAWTKAVVEQAEKYDMSWHYWCFKNCGGFEASNGSSWYGSMLSSFKLK